MKKTNQTKAKKKSNAKQGACHKAEPPFCLDASNYRSGFASVVKLLEGRKNVLVLAGAGISVSCGIPDFRSRGCGLYATLDADEYGLSCPEDLFEWEVFRDDPRPFYRFAKALYFPKGRDKPLEPSDSHRFLALLQKKGMLLRVYTQNIDGLEQAAGVSPKKMVYAHGSLQWATCCKCKHRVSSADIEDSILAGTVPRCTQNASPPEEKPVSKRSSSRKRARPVRSPARKGCGGVLKPGVTFFGETLHGNVSRSLEIDREKADALVVIGTSLSVCVLFIWCRCPVLGCLALKRFYFHSLLAPQCPMSLTTYLQTFRGSSSIVLSCIHPFLGLWKTTTTTTMQTRTKTFGWTMYLTHTCLGSVTM